MASKYGFDGMSVGDELSFSLKRKDGLRVKYAAAGFFRKRDWQLIASVKKNLTTIKRGALKYGEASTMGVLGQKPSKGSGFEEVGVLGEFEGVSWIVFRREQEMKNSQDRWATYKIVADGRSPQKANFWVARNEQSGKLGFCRDLKLMQAHKPWLFDALSKFFLDNFGAEIWSIGDEQLQRLREAKNKSA